MTMTQVVVDTRQDFHFNRESVSLPQDHYISIEGDSADIEKYFADQRIMEKRAVAAEAERDQLRHKLEQTDAANDDRVGELVNQRDQLRYEVNRLRDDNKNLQQRVNDLNTGNEILYRKLDQANSQLAQRWAGQTRAFHPVTITTTITADGVCEIKVETPDESTAGAVAPYDPVSSD